ncbi:MAG: radical SAM protein [Acidobacteria bacterium]|nr:radical SAM protein [Acidobacteriota bacterium]
MTMTSMRVLLVTPPMTQPNTPYPATAYLTGFLRQHGQKLGVHVAQADPALGLFLRVFSRAGLGQVLDAVAARAGQVDSAEVPPSVAHLLACGAHYLDTIEPVVRFLQGRDPSLALRIAGRAWLPEGPRFDQIGDARSDDDDEEPLAWAFGALGTTDRARYLASLYVDDLSDAVRDGVDPRFQLSRYGEQLAASAASFDALQEALEGPPTLIDAMLDELTMELVDQHEPDLVGLSAPFPGNVYGAFRMARTIKAQAPTTRIVLGGGWVNTELRDLSEPRVFEYVDYVTLDDGERPLLALLANLRQAAGAPAARLVRTFLCVDGAVVYEHDPSQPDIPLRDAGTPTYDGLPLDSYVSLFEMLNPMHRLWSDGRWNKLTVAHGCYWKRCAFCDVSLDYIARYDPVQADLLVDRIETLVQETGQTGFHFVDEAAPPAGLEALAERLVARNVAITWWGNIRFEKAFTSDLAARLAASGCVAVSGGLEVASDRLLELMQKGVTVEQVARVTRAFTDAGVMVHAYLMYGFPTETLQETIDALERVRQLFEAGCIQSGFWHRFTVTAHSRIGLEPERYGITLAAQPPPSFAHNERPFVDPTGTDHEFLGEGLRAALYNYMHGLGLDADVRSWFARDVPRPMVPGDLIARALGE